jgi:hypothetical protein
MPPAHLDHLLDTLDLHRQRATEQAVAAFVGRPAPLLLAGRPRDARHSWVVNEVTRLPSGYRPEEMHPELRVKPGVLASVEQLDAWLRNPS